MASRTNSVLLLALSLMSLGRARFRVAWGTYADESDDEAAVQALSGGADEEEEEDAQEAAAAGTAGAARAADL